MGLQHPNIVNVKEVVLGGKHNLHTFIVMEYVENDLNTLMEHLKRKQKSFSLAEVKGAHPLTFEASLCNCFPVCTTCTRIGLFIEI